jgi:branched-chain amino acid transport system permease protein
MGLVGQAIADSLLLWGLYALMATPLSLTFGVMRIVNFAHGEFIMLGAYAAYWSFTLLGVDPLIALPGIMIVGAGFGYAIYYLVIERVLTARHLNQILLMFGLGLVIQNVALMLWAGDGRSALPDYAMASEVIGDVVIPEGRLFAAIVAIVLIAVVFLWLRLTETGRALQAVSQNREAAMLMGINPKNIYAIAFSVGTALAAGTGAAVSFFLTISPFMGFPILVKSIAIVILGGMGSLIGTLLAAGILATSETVVSYFVPDGIGWAEGISFLLLLVILLLRPRGIIRQAVEQ